MLLVRLRSQAATVLAAATGTKRRQASVGRPRKQTADKRAREEAVQAPAPAPPAPPALDLRAGAPVDTAFHSVDRYVVFSDLHVSPNTLATSMDALRRVHKEACERDAGIIFLGDFWDKRGDLPVACLNEVITEVQRWTQPTLMLVGNHDQLDLGGRSHSLLAVAATMPRCHVFDVPSLFAGALWLPYRRDEAALRGALAAALQQQEEGGGLRAVFAHADVLTAHMNAAWQSKAGVAPDTFPADVPVYMGHYHYPHTVQHTRITYVGSPYQVTRSEEGQAKRLLVLDRTWRLLEEVLLDVGPRHFTLPGLAEGLAAAQQRRLRPGDRVRCVVEEDRMPPEAERVRRALEEQGVVVEVQLQPAAQAPRIADAEQRSMDRMLEAYAAATGMPPQVLERARRVLQELPGGASAAAPRATHVSFHSITVEGFGPFYASASYPLLDAGLRVLTGRNEDDLSASSNGAGKTSLVSSLLWAFNPGEDGRDLKRSEVLNDDKNKEKKKARVLVTGAVNGVPFELERSASEKSSQLRLTLDGEDATMQSIRATELEVKRLFHTDLLARVVSLTHDDILGLLNANDAEFKKVLGAVVSVELWEAAKEVAGAKVKEARRQLTRAQAEGGEAARALAKDEESCAQAAAQSAEWEQRRAADLAEAATQLRDCVHTQGGLIDALQGAHDTATALDAWVVAARAELQRLHTAVEAAQGEAEAAAQAQAPAPSPPPLQAPAAGGRAHATQPPAPPDLDEAEAARRLQPLEAALREADAELVRLQRATHMLEGQLQGKESRLHQYEALLHRQHRHARHTHHSHTARRGRAAGAGRVAHAPADEAVAQADLDVAVPAAVHLGPVCDKCLQPVDIELYERNLSDMASEVEALRQQGIANEQQLQQQEVVVSDLTSRLSAERRAIDAERREVGVKLQELLRQQQAQQAAAEAARREAEAAAARAWQEQQWRQAQVQERRLELARQEAELESVVAVACRARQRVDEATEKLARRLNDAALRDSIAPLLPEQTEQPGSTQDAREWCDHLDSALQHAAAACVQAEATRARMQQLQSQPNPHARMVAMLTQRAEEQRSRLAELASEAARLEAETRWLGEVEAGFSREGVPSFVLEGALGDLQARTAHYLQELSSSMALVLSATREASGKPAPRSGAQLAQEGASDAAVREVITKRVHVQSADGDLLERSVAQLSSGERKRVALALALGFVDLAAARGGLSTNLLLLDEVLEALDGEGCARVAATLRAVPDKTIIVVGQAESFVVDAFGVVDTVVKRGRHASLELARA